MKNFKEFMARMESDLAFREKFRDVKDEAQLLKLARAEGYDVEKLDEEDLDAVAGGDMWDALKMWWNAQIAKNKEAEAKKSKLSKYNPGNHY
ncbi:MAG: Nif11-like leader peptide family natural product precursor [Selenomonadaceae bacterium]|nr:Nif11-like leader peptide family natural product precursor [Selenomonadaceae bacterium]